MLAIELINQFSSPVEHAIRKIEHTFCSEQTILIYILLNFPENWLKTDMHFQIPPPNFFNSQLRYLLCRLETSYSGICNLPITIIYILVVIYFLVNFLVIFYGSVYSHLRKCE